MGPIKTTERKNANLSYILQQKKTKGIKSILKAYLSIAVQLPMVNSVYKFFYKRKVSAVLGKGFQMRTAAHIETYNVCNGHCVFCYYREMTRPKEVMSMELFKKIVDDLKANGFTRISPDFYSDPFFDPHIFERIKYAKEIGLKIHMFTNASLITKEKADKLLECPPDSMVISIDGVNAETDKKIRPGLNLEVIKSNLHYLIEERNRRGSSLPKITTVFVLQKENFHEVEQYKKEWQNLADKVDVNPDNLSVMKLPKVFTNPFPCVRLFGMLCIMSNGKMALCSNDFDGKNTLGDFNKQTYKEIIASPTYQLYTNIHKNFRSDLIDACKKCAYSYDLNSWKWWKM